MKNNHPEEIVHQWGHLKPVLQYRWQLVHSDHDTRLQYFGIRNYPHHHQRILPIPSIACEIIDRFDGSATLASILENRDADTVADLTAVLTRLIDQGIIVDQQDRRSPATQDNHQTCNQCVSNNYVVPGLEFNEDGICAFCQCMDNEKDIRGAFFIGGDTVTESELLEIHKTNSASFDVLALYTGGKDSSYLLWYLSQKLGLKVLACNWNLPFASATAIENMRNAPEKLPNVEFIERTVSWGRMQHALKTLISKYGIPCICPVISYALFYPVAVHENIPIIMDGIESSQTALARITEPTTSASFGNDMSDRDLALSFLRNITHPNTEGPLSYVEQFYATIKNTLEPCFAPLAKILANIDRYEQLPRIKRLKSEKLYQTWSNVGELLAREIGWKMPEAQEGLLHTSCDIERVKDFVHFKRFCHMTDMFLPQSVLEISSAIKFGHLTREQGLSELAERGYYETPDELTFMLKRVGFTNEELDAMDDEVKKVFGHVRLSADEPTKE